MAAAKTDLEPLPARSVALSLLLGSHPDRMSPAQLTRSGEHLGVPPATMRVALTRAVAAGDLVRVDGDYALGERLADRQRRQDEGLGDTGDAETQTTWDGTWEMSVVVVAGRSGADRAALRERLTRLRLAEVREGVWTRPANLRRPATFRDDPVLQAWRAEPDENPAALAARLWDLTGWATTGEALLRTFDETRDPPLRLAAAARIVRHLAADPLLPDPLLPPEWPGARLRAAYADYQRELRALG